MASFIRDYLLSLKSNSFAFNIPSVGWIECSSIPWLRLEMLLLSTVCYLRLMCALDYLFLVVVEWDHLAYKLVGYLVYWSHLVRCESDMDILDSPNNRLKFRVINAIKRFHYSEVIVDSFVFMNSLLNWGKMLLITQVNMIQ